MKFIQAHIHGFGKWIDTSFTFNTDGLTCIVGANESGKSTFQTFITFMLFGFPPKKRAFYRPKTSGTLGGELVIQLEDGQQVTIQRFDGRKNGAAICILESGEEKDEDWFNDVLKGMTAEIFASTFQFSTEDLYAFRQMEVEQMGEVLLNASISGASQLREVEKELEQKKDDLFKPRGTRPQVNEQLEQLENIQQQVNKHALVQEKYQSLIEEMNQSTETIHHLQRNINDARKEIVTWEHVQQALPSIRAYEQADVALTDAPFIPFNEHAPEFLAEQKRFLREYTSNKALIQKNIDRYIEEMNHISLLDPQVVEEGEAILQEKAEWSYVVRLHHDLTRELETIHTEIDTKLMPYQTILTKEIIEDLDLPPFIDKKWKELARKAEQLDASRLDQADTVKNEEEKIKKLEGKIAEQTIDVLPKEEYNYVKETLRMDEETRSNKWYMQKISQETSDQKKHIQKEYKHAVNVLIGTNVVALLFALAAFLTSITWLYHGAIISGAIGWIQWYYKRMEYIRVGNVEQPMDTSELDVLEENQRKFLQEQFDQHHQAVDSIELLTRQKEDMNHEHGYAQRNLKHLENEEQQLNTAIEEEVLCYPFLDRVEISDWEEVGHLLQDIQSLQLKLSDIHHQVEQNNQLLLRFERKVQAWWNDFYHKASTEPMTTLLTNIEQKLHADMKARQRHEKIHFEKEEALESQRQLEDSITHVQQEILAIYKEANVATEEAFIQQYEAYIDQQQKVKEMHEAKQQLIHLFSPSTWDAYIHQEIEGDKVEYELLHNRQLIQQYEEELEEVRSKLATAKAQQTHIEQTDSFTYSERMHMFEMEKEKLQELSKTWAIYEVTQSILEQTKQTYMQKHLDAVIHRATEHFSYITNHEYIHIHVNSKEKQIRVENNKHAYYAMEELSKGTRDQLYISIRIAMSEHIQKNTPTPYVFDDSFVHFDKQRMERMIDRIIYLSKHHQVVLFTCKDEIEQMIALHGSKNDISFIRIDA